MREGQGALHRRHHPHFAAAGQGRVAEVWPGCSTGGGSGDGGRGGGRGGAITPLGHLLHLARSQEEQEQELVRLLRAPEETSRRLVKILLASWLRST